MRQKREVDVKAGESLRELCRRKGVTMTEVGRQCGLSQTQISRLANGGTWTLRNVMEIAEVLQMPYGHIINLEEMELVNRRREIIAQKRQVEEEAAVRVRPEQVVQMVRCLLPAGRAKFVSEVAAGLLNRLVGMVEGEGQPEEPPDVFGRPRQGKSA